MCATLHSFSRMDSTLLLFILFGSSPQVIFSIPLEEITLLQQLYQQTNGENWLWRPSRMGPQWNFNVPSPNPCNTNGSAWQGITCTKLPKYCSVFNSPSCSVTSLSLELYGLRGHLPQNWTGMNSLTSLTLPRNRLIGNLSQDLPLSLRSIDLDFNFLSGTLPYEFGSLIALSYLAIEGNRLHGAIPSSFGDLIQLSHVALSLNFFSQTIPTELGKLSNLKYLSLSLGRLTGPIPSSFGLLLSLDTLDVSFNSLTNSIPSSIGNLLALTSLVLDFNYFSQKVPSELAFLTKLADLSLATNYFSGQIYFLNENFFQLSRVSLGYNLLTGPLPPFNSSPNLVKLDFDMNDFSQTIPAEFGLKTALSKLSLYDNMMTGSIPSSFGGLLLITQLDLSFNHLTGTIPSALGSMSSIADLHVTSNLLSGPIPSEFGTLSAAQSLVFSGNLLTSVVPCTIQHLSEMSVFMCDYNYLSGICPDLILPSSLEIIDISLNLISGSIPEQLMIPSHNLLALDASDNFISGHLPDLSSLLRVNRINFANNHLSGSIPSSIGSLSELHQLYLGVNFLTGSLKNWLWQTSNQTLVNVDISANNLEGKISAEIFDLPFLQTLALTLNCFEGTLPHSICDAEDLVVLALDGLGSNSNCYERILPWSDLHINDKISGQIPNCLWAMKNLTSLSLSGNGLTGTIGDLSNSSLINLTLSHNHLSGTIPRSLQTHSFQNLDLSYNKFTGEYSMISILDLKNTSSRLVMEVNRLSGHFPTFPSDSSSDLHLNILRGNMFSCQNIPDLDANSASYRCGSRSFDEALIGAGAITFIVLVLCLTFICARQSTVKIFVNSLGWAKSCGSILLSHSNTLYSYLHPFNPSVSWDKESVEFQSLKKTMERFTQLNHFTLFLSLSGIIFTVPVYAIRIWNDNYSTHAHLYRWEWTAAYLSGALPSALLLLAWILNVCVFLSCVKRYMWGERSFQPFQGGSQISSTLSQWLSTFNDIFVVLINIAVMSTVNALYIIATNLNYSPNLILVIQISMALFKALWNRFYLPLLNFSKQSHRLRIFLLVLNSIFIPCIATAFTSPACFQELIQKPEDIVSTYYYVACDLYLVHEGSFQCLTQQSLRVDVPPFTPSFTYNYLCGSTLLSSYLPIYFYQYLLQILTTPLGSYLLSQYLPFQRLPPRLQSTLPGLLWPNHWVAKDEHDLINLEQNKKDESSIPDRDAFSSSSLMNENRIANKFMHDVLVLITFGLCSPLLCCTISLSMFLSIFEIHIMVGRFIISRGTLHSRNSSQENSPLALTFDSSFPLLESRVNDLAPACRNLVWIVIWSSCFFFMFLCWDIAGDEFGLKKSLWVPVVIFSSAVIFYLYGVFYPLSSPQPNISVLEGREEVSSLHMQPASPTSPAMPPILEIEMEKSSLD